MTQENDVIRKDVQIPVEINGKTVWCDPNMIELLVALNNAGLVTRSHCGGHGSGNKFVVIRSENITDVQILNHGEYNEILISWSNDA